MRRLPQSRPREVVPPDRGKRPRRLLQRTDGRSDPQLSKETGGTFTAADLSEFQPEWVTPISTTYRGWTVSELPPNSDGIAALMMLNIMEQYPMSEWGYHSTKALHVMIEAKKLAYADLIRYIGDP